MTGAQSDSPDAGAALPAVARAPVQPALSRQQRALRKMQEMRTDSPAMLQVRNLSLASYHYIAH
jgi:hypothetical protein